MTDDNTEATPPDTTDRDPDAPLTEDEALASVGLTRADLVEKYRRIAVLNTAIGIVVVRAPKPGEYDRWQNAIADADTRKQATKQLVTSCVVYPDVVKFRAACIEYPGLALSLGNHVQKLASGTVQELGKE